MSRRQLFGSLCGMVLVVNLGRVVFAPLLEPLRTALGADTAALGLLATLVWLGSAVSRPPTAWIMTRVPRHVVLFTTGAMLAAMAVLAALASNIRALQFAALFIGFASGGYFTAAKTLLSELFPDRIGRVLGVHGTAAHLAAVGAPLFVTAVLAVGTWQTAFWLMAAGAVVSTLVFVIAAWVTDLPETSVSDRDFLDAIRTQWRIILTGAVMLGAAAFVWTGLFNFYVTYLVETGLTENTGRFLLSVTFAAGLPALIISGRLIDALPSVPYILVLLGGFLVSVFALTLVSGPVALGIVGAGMGYSFYSLLPAGDTYLLGSLPDRHRASAYAAYSASFMTIQSGGSWVVGTLDATYTFAAIFQLLAVGLLVLLGALVLAHLGGWLPATARA